MQHAVFGLGWNGGGWKISWRSCHMGIGRSCTQSDTEMDETEILIILSCVNEYVYSMIYYNSEQYMQIHVQILR